MVPAFGAGLNYCSPNTGDDWINVKLWKTVGHTSDRLEIRSLLSLLRPKQQCWATSRIMKPWDSDITTTKNKLLHHCNDRFPMVAVGFCTRKHIHIQTYSQYFPVFSVSVNLTLRNSISFKILLWNIACFWPLSFSSHHHNSIWPVFDHEQLRFACQDWWVSLWKNKQSPQTNSE